MAINRAYMPGLLKQKFGVKSLGALASSRLFSCMTCDLTSGNGATAERGAADLAVTSEAGIQRRRRGDQADGVVTTRNGYAEAVEMAALPDNHSGELNSSGMQASEAINTRLFKASPISLAILSSILIVTQPVFSFSVKHLLAQTADPALRPANAAEVKTEYVTKVEHLRRDGRMARRMARYHWLDKAAQANPAIVEAITRHRSAAKLLAKHPRLGYIAEADHYLCRRLTKWKGVARLLAASPQACRVIALDPEGIYSAIKRDKRTARILAKNPNFDQMIVENPDLGQLIATYM